MTQDALNVVAGVSGECCVCLVLLWRRTWKQYPIFFVYLFWTIASDLSFLIFPQMYTDKLRNYVIEIAVDSALQFFVLLELGWSVIKPVRSSLPKGAKLVVPGILILLTLLCWPLAGFAIPGGLSQHGYELVVLQQTVSLLRVMVLLVLVAFSQFLSIGWRDRELQIASGLGFYSILSLVVWVLHTHQAVGPQYHWLDLVTSFGYLGTLAYWVVCFSIKEPERKKISPQMQHFLVSIGGAARAERFALEAAVGQNRGKNSSQRRN